MNEGLDKNQKRVGQLGPTEKVGKNGPRGKLVGANESADGNTPSTKMFLEVDDDDELLDEADLIISPALFGKGDRSFKPKHADHEVSMARNDCFQSAVNAAKVFKMLRNVSEMQGIDGWVASKITLAADYLNTVREYLEGQNLSANVMTNENTNASNKSEWSHIGFSVRSDILWPAKLYENRYPQQHAKFQQYISNYQNDLDRPQKNSRCILAMFNMSDADITVFYGTAEYIRETSSHYVLKIDSGTHKYSKRNQMVFKNRRELDHCITRLLLEFEGKKLDMREMPVMETKVSDEHTNRERMQDVAEEKLDELKCWPGYTRVQGVPAGSPGSCKKKSKTKESVAEVSYKRMKCPECGGAAYGDEMLAEKRDACYHKVKSRYKVWPSAYASGALVKCRKVGAKNWGNKSGK